MHSVSGEECLQMVKAIEPDTRFCSNHYPSLLCITRIVREVFYFIWSPFLSISLSPVAGPPCEYTRTSCGGNPSIKFEHENITSPLVFA